MRDVVGDRHLATGYLEIDGYQVCKKRLKDRKGRVLSAEEIEHYQRVVVTLNETIRSMGGIDEVIEEHGGWPMRRIGRKRPVL